MSSKPWLAEMNRRRAKHGMARSSTYHAWSAMRQRCLCETHPHFKDYGGRGIGICARWSDFANFLTDMGEKPKGCSLDRINNNGDYCPENCRWTSQKVQCRNRRSNKFVEFNGESLPIAEWAERTGIERKTLEQRLRVWPVSRALTEPYIKRKAA